MDTYFIFITFLFIAFAACVSCQNCERSHYENCLNKLLAFTERGNLQFAMTSEELRQECVQAQSAVNCLTTYKRKCLKSDEMPQFKDGMSGPARITEGLCSDGEFRTKYINSLPCLKNISDGLQYCREKYERNQKDIILVEYEDKTHLQCCSFDGYRRCLRMVMETQDGCREGTAEFLEQLSDKMGGVLTEGTCSEYFERCTGHSDAPRNSLPRVLLIAVVFVSGLLLL